MNCGIVSYGTSIPRRRIGVRDIWRVWENVTPDLFDKMSFVERAVLTPNEDAMTLAVAAGEIALERSGLDRKKIGAVFFGSCTNPYDTKASATVVMDALRLPPSAFAVDLQFGAKSGTSAIIAAAAQVEAGFVDYALAIGSDTMCRHFAPGTQMEYSASAGAFACVVGREGVIARLEGFSTWSSDLADYFRTEGERYIQLGGGWLGYVSNWGLLEHAVPASKALLEKLKLEPDRDFDAVILPQATGVQPMMVGGSLGFDIAAVMSSVLTASIGDCGSATTLISLARWLDFAENGQRAFLCAYGYGAGADALSFKTTDLLEERQPAKDLVSGQIEDKILVDYALAAKYEFKYLRPATMVSNYL
ncbi:MAG: hydroxymethylglutaryl-CoA synthase [Spirochaetaceae bacterium]|nr:hydroxymethylglutaryl-CoA synthase [Spirochaetaceae bacterium]